MLKNIMWPARNLNLILPHLSVPDILISYFDIVILICFLFIVLSKVKVHYYFKLFHE